MNNIFKHTITDGNIYFKYANGKTEKPEKEFHTYNEIIYFINGEAEFICEQFSSPIPENTIIVIPKETFHQLNIKGDKENYCRCIINFSDISSKNPNTPKFIPLTPDLRFLYNKLISFSLTDDNQKSDLLLPVLSLILDEINTNNDVNINEKSHNEVIKAVIVYINDNLQNKITVAHIAKLHGLSVSSLSHTFKAEMNIPLHKFILKKRLITAHRKIADGVPSTVAALECGFGDYSGFYKQYKKMFGFSPSKKS